MKITYLLLLIFTHIKNNTSHSINLNDYYNNQNNLNFASNDNTIEKMQISYYLNNESEDLQNIIKILNTMIEIDLKNINTINLKEAIIQSEKNNITICLAMQSYENTIIWKLYNAIEKKFITGKKYIIKSTNQNKIIKTILYDIWKALFDEDTNPFNMYLIYLNNKEYENKNQIMIIQPFIDHTPKCLFESHYPIIDMTTIPSYPKNTIMFTQQKQRYMYLKKINSHGQIIPIYKTKQTISSPTANTDGLFFIENETLKYYYFNPITKEYKIIILDHNQDYASIYSIPKEHTILASRNNTIYKINYEIDDLSKKITNINGSKITEKNIISTNMTYASHTDQIITSQKINNYYQLVIYNGTNKIILTTSPIHKQDPVISPCQNYISYIAQDEQGKRYIEIIHINTKKTIRITPLPGLYRFTNWIIK